MARSDSNDSLTRSGFRRSQTIAYRPACKTCGACRSVRIDVAAFKISRRWRKVLARNAMMEREASTARATREQFRLLKRYLDVRHPGGGMTDMEIATMQAWSMPARLKPWFSNTATSSKPAAGDDGALQAAALTDVLRDGLSMVYSFYRPELADRSVGSYMVLDHVRLAAELDLPYVYLGYWVRGSDKMGYKADFTRSKCSTANSGAPARRRDLAATATAPAVHPPAHQGDGCATFSG